MKLTYALLCIACLVAVRPATGRADELDELLSSEPSASQVESAPAAVQAGLAYDLENNDALDYSDHSRWQPPIVVPMTRTTKSPQPTTGAAEKPAPPAGLNVVPEPSAIALGVLALVYFLVFGRRRRLA